MNADIIADIAAFGLNRQGDDQFTVHFADLSRGQSVYQQGGEQQVVGGPFSVRPE